MQKTAGRPRLAFTGLVLLLSLLFSDVLFLGRTLDPSVFVPAPAGFASPPGTKGPPFCNDGGASVLAFQPWNRLIRGSILEDGEIPLWNPYQGTGLPLAANFQSGVFSPLQWPFFLFDSIIWWDWLMVLRLLIPGWFLYLLLKRLGVSPLPAWIAGAGYMLSGYFIDYINMNHLSVEMFLAPTLYFLDRALRSPDRRAEFGLVICLGLGILGGMPESTFLTWLFAGSYALHLLIGRNWLVWGRCAAWFVLAAAVGSVVLVPGFEYLLLAHSKHYALPWGVSSLPGSTLIGLVMPHFFGPPGSLGWLPGVDKAFTVPSSVGVGALVLAGIGLAGVRNRVGLFMAGWAILGLLKMYGVPPVSWIGQLPAFDLVIYTKYLQPIVGFCLWILAGFGLQALTRRPIGRGWAVLPLAILLAVSSWTAAFLSRILDSPHTEVRFAVLVFVAAAAAVAAIWVAGVWNLRRRPEVVLLVLTMATLGESCLLAFRLHPHRTPPIEEPRTLASLESNRQFRITGDYYLLPNTSSGFGIQDIRVLDPLLPATFVRMLEDSGYGPVLSRVSFREFPDYESLLLDAFGVRSVIAARDARNLLLRERPIAAEDRQRRSNWADPPLELFRLDGNWIEQHTIALRGPGSGLTLIAESQGELRLKLALDREVLVDTITGPGSNQMNFDLGKRPPERVQIILEGSGDQSAWIALAPTWNGQPYLQVTQDPQLDGFRVFRRPTSVPIASFVTEYEVAPSAEAARQRFLREPARMRERVILEVNPELDPRLLPAGKDGEAKIEVVDLTANELSLQTETFNPGLLVLARTYYPGWSATINDRPAEVLRANGGFQALALPAGNSAVELRFRPASVYGGGLITVVGIILTGVLLRFAGRR